MRYIFQKILLITSIFMVTAMVAQAKEPYIFTKSDSNYGAGGYDVVSYFTENKPVEGNQQYQTEWQGAQWLFSSAENLDAFVADPERYAPQYGGYCAWAMARNSLASGSPKQWSIVDDKLYLNYNWGVKKLWEGDKQNLIGKADGNWPNALN